MRIGPATMRVLVRLEARARPKWQPIYPKVRKTNGERAMVAIRREGCFRSHQSVPRVSVRVLRMVHMRTAVQGERSRFFIFLE